MSIIEPKILKGFRDSLPQQEIRRKKMFAQLENAFALFGFVPIDTPALEYADVLLGKGGGETDKQVYRFSDNGGRDISMRFDLTVPLARFIAANRNELTFPFKRYHIAKVWRGENTQRGRYREFYQCDFDIVGTDSVSADAEILFLMKSSFDALGIDNFKIHLSNRGILNHFLKVHGIENKSVEILRAIDKLAKAGNAKVMELLTDAAGAKSSQIAEFITMEETFEKTLDKLILLSKGDNAETERVKTIYTVLKDNSIENYYLLDPAITRGLDYYTGIVFETFLTDKKEIGSVFSGGRYNNLASLYTNENMPGVGASIGIDRLLAAFEESKEKSSALCDCIIFNIDDSLLSLLHKTAGRIRAKGFSCEVYPEKCKLNKQFAYAEKNNIPAGVIIGSEEAALGAISVKDLISRTSCEKISIDAGIEKISEIVKINKK